VGKTIKGITVQIDGEAKGLGKALEDVEKQSRSMASELKTVDRLLKLDPGNLTLVKQKQDILKDSISATSDKLKVLKEAQKQVEQQFKSGDIGRDQYLAFQGELVSTEKKLSDLKKSSKDVSVIGTAFGNVKDKAIELYGKLEPVENGLKKVGKAAADITGAGIKTVETAVGGAGKAFGAYIATAGAAAAAITGITISSANNAKEISVMSERVGFSTKAYQEWDFIAKKAGTSMDTLQGGITDLAEKMDDAAKGEGEASEIFQRLGLSVKDSNGNLKDQQVMFEEVVVALQGVTDESERQALATKLMSTTGEELLPLLNGEIGTMDELKNKASELNAVMSEEGIKAGVDFKNSLLDLQTGFQGTGNVMASVFMPALSDSVKTITSSLPDITNSIAGLFSGQNSQQMQTKLTSDLTNLGNGLIKNLNQQLPTFLNGLNAIITSLLDSVSAVLPTLVQTTLPVLIDSFFGLVDSVVAVVPDLLPTIVEGALILFMGLLDGLNEVIPQLMEMLPVLINDIGNMLIENLPIIIESGMQLIISLITGITQSIPTLMEKVIALIPIVVEAITSNLPALIDAGLQLIVALAQGLPQAIPAIVEAMPVIIGAIIDTIFQTDWLDIGIQIIKGIGNGLVEGVKSIGSQIASVGDSIANEFKNFFGIHSPSRLFRDEIGTYLAQGIGVGFSQEMISVTKSMQKSLPTSFNTDVSLNAKNSGNISGQSLSGINFNQYNYSPKALSRFEIYKQTQTGLQLARLGVK